MRLISHCTPFDVDCLLCNPGPDDAPIECVVCRKGVDYDAAVPLSAYAFEGFESGPAHVACRTLYQEIQRAGKAPINPRDWRGVEGA